MRRAQAPGERASAYLVTLLVLLVLTALGLSLSLVTQTEIVAAAQERVLERTFYAAESGVELSVARALADGYLGPSLQVRSRSALDPERRVPISERVESSAFFCLGDSPCNLCSVNQGRGYARRNHALGVNASRLAGDAGGTEVELGRKAVSSMVDLEPFPTTADCLVDPAEAARFRFDDF
jgi:hypothetical protein